MQDAAAIDRQAENPHLIYLLLMLSMTTGLVDAITVLGLGKVFTANMTGNVVFLGFAVAGTPGFNVGPYLAAIASFLLGAAVAGRFRSFHLKGHPGSWLLNASMVEASLLWIAALLAVHFDIPAQQPAAILYAILALTGLAMGFRNGIVRQLKIADLTTTVLTLSLTGLAADSHVPGSGGGSRRRRLAGAIAIFLGALIGALLVLSFGLVTPLVLAGALALAATSACTLLTPRAPHAGNGPDSSW